MLIDHAVRNPWDYRYPATFDEGLLRTSFRSEFGRDPRYTEKSWPAFRELVGFMEADSEVADIRWMAYMLATVYFETSQPIREKVRVLTKKGTALKDRKGHPVTRTVKRWAITMQPVTEVGRGAGREYFLPVKVKKLTSTTARITEQDGHQFIVSSGSRPKKLTKAAERGSPANAPSTKIYDDDEGDEISYYGRGYVQLTWWSNYAAAGGTIGLGLDLLYDPDKVEKPDIAYAIMSYGMRTGEGFANKHKFTDYFHGPIADYVGARAMVNGKNKRDEIAAIARKFEFVLFVGRSANC